MVRPMPGQPPSLFAGTARNCNQSAAALVEASKGARAFVDECAKLAKYAKRIQPLLEDLEGGVYSGPSDEAGASALRVQQGGDRGFEHAETVFAP